MKKILQSIFIALLFAPMLTWAWMAAHLHPAEELCTDELCREDQLNAKITNIN